MSIRNVFQTRNNAISNIGNTDNLLTKWRPSLLLFTICFVIKALDRRKMSRIPRPRSTCGSSSPVFDLQTKSADLHPSIIKQARQSGQLNLSNRGLVVVPDKVWHLNEIGEDERQTMSVSFSTDSDNRWWEQADLVKLCLSSNKLTSISAGIANLSALSILDLHDNMLVELPVELGLLNNLNHVNLSRNKLCDIPEAFYNLKMIRYLNLSNNCLKSMSENLGNFSLLTDLDLSNNELASLPKSIGFLGHVNKLNLANNCLQTLPPEIGSMLGLQILDASCNKLDRLPQDIGELCHLTIIYLRQNCLSNLPVLHSCGELKELHIGNNALTELSGDWLEAIGNIKVLDLKDNKIENLPPEILLLEDLERLDLRNNNLNTLPPEIGTLPHLKSLSLEGNPLRNIRRDILQRGTVQLLKFLRGRLQPTPVNDHSNATSATAKFRSKRISDPIANIVEPEIDIFTLKKSRCLDYSNRQAGTVPESFFTKSAEAEVGVINLSKNQLCQVPEGVSLTLGKLTEFQIAFNKIEFIPAFIGLAQHLTYLDVSNNRLAALPSEISSVKTLREIWITGNRFTQIPTPLYGLPNLEIILAANNSIEDIDLVGLRKLEKIATLDLQNNSILHVPPELGNLTQLRSLQLEGNPFRHPRNAILTKGTGALLEYLRDRIPK